VKPAAGLFERVFLGQLLEPVIVETVKGRNRFSNDKPGTRYFSPSSDFPGTYVHDPGTVKTVSAFAIYGKVDGYTNVVLAADGLLDPFEVADDELDRMKGIALSTRNVRLIRARRREMRRMRRWSGTGGARPKQTCFVPMATSKFLQLVTSGCEWNQYGFQTR
jgi:hypothetical protein